MPTCRKLFKQAACLALALAFASAGRSIAARMAMIAITTNSSIKVKALLGLAALGKTRERLEFIAAFSLRPRGEVSTPAEPLNRPGSSRGKPLGRFLSGEGCVWP